MQAWADGEALARQANGGLKQTRPRQDAMLLMRLRQHVQHARRAHSTPAHHGLVKGQGLTCVIEQSFFSHRRWRSFSAIKHLNI